MSLKQKLESLRPELARAAQQVIDEWEQDEEGIDPELGAGGVCDRIADAMLGAMYDRIEGIEAAFGAPEGHDHEWVVVTDGHEAFIVDIPPHVYEVGGGYSWRKVEGAQVSPSDIVIDPLDMELAGELMKQEEHAMQDNLIALADALQAMGEGSTATLVRALDRFAQERPTWAERFFKANPEFMDRAEQFAAATGAGMANYINMLDALPEDIGRQKVHKDLGYVGMPWSPPGTAAAPKKPEPPKVVTQTKGGDLVWPFPPPTVLKRPEAFISAAIAWAGAQYSRTGRKGEIEASRLYLRHLMKDVAPALARTLQQQWAAAANDPDKQHNLRLWWKALVLVWQRLQDMIGSINAYEGAPGYYEG
jgi:hypothetical protein